MANCDPVLRSTRLVQYESGSRPPSSPTCAATCTPRPTRSSTCCRRPRSAPRWCSSRYLYQIRNARRGHEPVPELLERFERFQGGFVWIGRTNVSSPPTRPAAGFPATAATSAKTSSSARPETHDCNGVVLPDLTPKRSPTRSRTAVAPPDRCVDARAAGSRWRNRHHALDTRGYRLTCRASRRRRGDEEMVRAVAGPPGR